MLKYLLVIAFILSPIHVLHAKSNQFQSFPAWQQQPPKVPNKVVNKNPPKPIVVPKKGK